MRIILQKDVEKLGNKYDVANVSDGYARNYLIPQGLAVMASPQELAQLKAQRRAYQVQLKNIKEEKKELAEKFVDVVLTFPMKVNEQDELFGSVTANQIEEKLQEAGYEVERRDVSLDEPLKELGEHEVGIHLGAGVSAAVKVVLTKEE